MVNKSEIKLKHVHACLMPESQYKKSAGFEHIELIHESAAGLSLDKICLQTEFLNKGLNAPLMIAPMTGGMEFGALLNQRWAKAAQHFGIAFGVGSQRLALENHEARSSFMVRAQAPDALIFANLGAAQLVESLDAKDALKAIEMIEADALFIHLNPLQEACQLHGDRNFTGILRAITGVVEYLDKYNIPVFVREVGFGLSQNAARALINCGVAGLDCAGAGGTSWAKVESLCASNEKYKRLGAVFGEWGIPTAQSIINVREIDKKIPLVASGGIRSGLDVAKAIKLGANIAAMAQPMLAAAIKGEEELFLFVEQIIEELKTGLFAAGASSLEDFLGKAFIRN